MQGIYTYIQETNHFPREYIIIIIIIIVVVVVVVKRTYP
jgi:t-SNARE complex subunit (syntaxin)